GTSRGPPPALALGRGPRSSRRLSALRLRAALPLTFVLVFVLVPALVLAVVPALLALPPVPLLRRLAPVAAVVRVPLRRRIVVVLLPLAGRYTVVADRHLQDRHRDDRRLHDHPRPIPARPRVPARRLINPVLMAVEEDVRRRLGRVVDERVRDHGERRWARQPDPDVDADLRPGECRHRE